MNKEDLKAIRELLQEELNPINSDIKSIKSQLDEHTQILRALEHSAEVSKSERDKMSNDITHIEGHLKSIDENIDVMKEMLGKHEVDITVLKRRPV